MTYDYQCSECGIAFEEQFPIGKAEKSVPCLECGSQSKRIFTSCNFILKGGGWPSKKISFNEEMTARNETAGRNMRKEHGDGPVRLVAHDYGNGDVREVKKK
jgi:putative FmdB family regulatory protein